jgi:threonine/homoserine/homoserine lactone efflux protein
MDLTGFALAVLLIELTPGPNMAWLVALVLGEGRKAGLAAIGGVALGLLANGLIAAVGASALLAALPQAASLVGFAGAAMMLYLAWEAWRASGETSPASVPREAPGRHFFAGFAINLFNPKAALFFLAVAPQFVAGGAPSIRQAITLALISVGIATAVHFLLIFGAASIRPVLLEPGRAKLVRRVLALAMVGVAAWFVAGALG